MTTTRPPDTPPAEAPAAEGVHGALAVVACVAACWLGALTATAEAFLTPLYAFGSRFPIAVVLAVVLNPLLLWGTHRVTGWLVGALLPGAV